MATREERIRDQRIESLQQSRLWRTSQNILGSDISISTRRTLLDQKTELIRRYSDHQKLPRIRPIFNTQKFRYREMQSDNVGFGEVKKNRRRRNAFVESNNEYDTHSIRFEDGTIARPSTPVPSTSGLSARATLLLERPERQRRFSLSLARKLQSLTEITEEPHSDDSYMSSRRRSLSQIQTRAQAIRAIAHGLSTNL